MTTADAAPAPLAFWVDAASDSRCGPRPDNQDRAYGDFQTLAVFDGVGGRAYGGSASAIALTQTLGALALQRQQGTVDLAGALGAANLALLQANQQAGFNSATTATVAALYLRGDVPFVSVAWIGDTPAYLVRGTGILKLTRAHEILDESTVPAFRLTRWLGEEATASPDLEHVALQEGDRIAIVSDGVSSVLDDATVGGIIATADTASAAAAGLIAKALRRGTDDNVSASVAILYRVSQHHTLSGSLVPVREEPPRVLAAPERVISPVGRSTFDTASTIEEHA